MSIQGTRADADRAEALVRALGAAIATRRLYDQNHAQVQACTRTFLRDLRSYLKRAGADRFRVTASGGRLSHEGRPVGIGTGALGTLARLLEEKGIGGLAFRAHLVEYVFRALLDWFASRRAMGVPEGEWPGLEILPAGSGDDHLNRTGESEAGRMPEFRTAWQVQARASRVLDGLVQDVRNRRPMDLKETADLVEWVADVAWSEGPRLVAPAQLQREDNHPFRHTINVFLTATTLLQPLTSDPRELARICMAVLLHDIGKARVPREILHRKVRLGEEEWAMLRSHPELGAEMLSKVRHLDTLPCEVAYCHHMRDDGLGYPVPAMPVQPGPVARIVQVADLFEALAAARPHAAGMSTKDAGEAMLALPGMAGRADVVALLVGWLTPSPPGCEVVLAGGERAIVVHADPDHPHHPLVRIHRDADGNDVRTSATVDLKETAAPEERPVAEVFLKPALMRTGREPSKVDRTLGEDWKPPAGDDRDGA